MGGFPDGGLAAGLAARGPSGRRPSEGAQLRKYEKSLAWVEDSNRGGISTPQRKIGGEPMGGFPKGGLRIHVFSSFF